MRLLLILLLAATAQANQVSTRAVDWRMLHGIYPWPTIVDNAEGGNQWNFPWDSEWGYGTVGYFTTTFTPNFDPIAVSMTFRLESVNAEYISVQVPEDAAKVRPIIMASTIAGCPTVEVNPIPCEFRSWWAHSTSYVLGSADGKTFTFVVPLSPEFWSSVYGVRGENSGGWFEYAMSHIYQVGFTFGGRYYGHGVKLGSGAATFRLLDYQFVPKESGGLP